jgi:hypothetical protein
MRLHLAALALALGLVPATASAEPTRPVTRPVTGYQWVDGSEAKILEPSELTYNTIYLNGCFEDGDCTFTRGYNDSRANRSSIGQGTVSKFAFGTVAWDAVVECVKKNYEPFNVVITDQDPGDAPHFEAVVGGFPAEIGMSDGVGGVSPFSCGIIDNAITYSFANIYGGSVDDICWTVSQETAHAYGLEHQALCEDPMTYDYNCSSRKWFHNVDVQCGEYESNPRNCECGTSATQNSFQAITKVFGEGTVETPTLAITTPAEGDKVQDAFIVNSEFTATVPMMSVGFYINNRLIEEKTNPPFAFIAPQGLSDGRMKLELRGTNVYGKKVVSEVNVVKGAPCEEASDCADTETCVDGRCVLGPGQPGGLGEACTSNGQCDSDLCGMAEEGQFCAEQCEVGAGGCPDGFGCLETGDMGVCWKGYDDGGGCRTSGGSSLPLGLGLGLALLWVRRRRA